LGLDEARKIVKDEAARAFGYRRMDICGVNERVNWKARSDEYISVFDMSLKK